MTIQSINPATEEVLASFDEFTPEQVECALETAATTFERWRRTTFAERSRLMAQASVHLRRQKEHLARLLTLEMGKPIIEAEAEIEKCAWNCEFYAENAERFLAREAVETNASESYVAFEPLGPILAIMPWNFPFWQVFRFAAPAVMAGNVALLKHASNVPQCALAIEDVFRTAGFPEGVFQALLMPGPAAQAVIEDRRIKAVTLTGSEETGAKVAQMAGHAIKKTVLELGGSDPFIVLADAALDEAARAAVRARNQNAGQSCIAAKRFIVVQTVIEEFERLLVDGTTALQVGDPMLRETQIGPLARSDLLDTLASQVQRSLEMGARLSVGGHRIEGRGYFYEPTIVSQVTPSMPVAREETFGPVAAVLSVRDNDEALAVANSTDYGLGASLWTGDVDRGKALARDIQAGCVFINGMVVSDPRLPFGGVKRSGYGRELSEFGIREFVNIQTVWVK